MTLSNFWSTFVDDSSVCHRSSAHFLPPRHTDTNHKKTPNKLPLTPLTSSLSPPRPTSRQQLIVIPRHSSQSSAITTFSLFALFCLRSSQRALPFRLSLSSGNRAQQKGNTTNKQRMENKPGQSLLKYLVDAQRKLDDR